MSRDQGAKLWLVLQCGLNLVQEMTCRATDFVALRLGASNPVHCHLGPRLSDMLIFAHTILKESSSCRVQKTGVHMQGQSYSTL